MADDKKSDDYRVDMPAGKEFSAPSQLPSRAPAANRSGSTSITENSTAAILAYCGSSILMTLTNKYVLSGVDFNLNFFLLAVQVCVSLSLWKFSLTENSRLCALQPFLYAKLLVSSHTETLTATRHENVCKLHIKDKRHRLT